MTRQDITNLGRDLLGETPGSDAALNPFAWNTWINQATAELCRASDCAYFQEQANLVSGQAQYAASCLYKLKSAWVLLADGMTQALLRFTQPITLDREVPLWRTAAAVGNPLYLVTGGDNTLFVFPAPNYSLTNGLTLEGYGVPDTSTWATPSSACPLPDFAHMAVAYRAATLRAIQTGQPDKMQMLDGLYQTEKGRLERDVKRLTEATRTASPDGYRGIVSSPYAGYIY